MNNCTNCGAEAADGANFCAQCGRALGRSSGVDVIRKAKTYACDAADDIIDGGEQIVTSPVSKKIAAGAAVGALVAAPLPIVGWAAGATIGAGLVAFKHLRKRG
jgi:hypothetical protein